MEGAFPAGFVWGLGTAAYQVEGAYREDGRGASIWDTFTGANTVGMPGGNCSYCCKEAPCPTNPAMGAKGATGNVACDHYHTWRSDIALMKSMGLKNYRFSISWPRVVPTGKVAEGINGKAIDFYNSLIDGLLDAGITPFVTLYHWDLPQALLSPPERQGWWSRDEEGRPNGQLLPDWLDYVNVCFSAFGDRVKTWITFNEAWTFTYLASGWGKAPCIPDYGNMEVDPYIAGHNVLVAHAMAVSVYRQKYQMKQGGKIGITNNCDWREPATNSSNDTGAAELAVEFTLGWFSDPVFSGTGDYPPAMRRLLGSNLPNFTEEQKRLVNGSADFFGLNHYGTGWARYAEKPGMDNTHVALSEDGFVQGQSTWLYSGPWGFRKLLNWVHRRYGGPPVYVTENGWSLGAEAAAEGRRDRQRAAFYGNYTAEMRKAIFEDGVDVRGYFGWSFLDNFEWNSGYAERFGTTFNDFAFGADPDSPAGGFAPMPTAGSQVRTRKDSSCWLEAVWRGNALVSYGSGFSGCPASSAFHGDYEDVRHPGCSRSIRVGPDGKSGRIVGKDSSTGTGCGDDPDIVWAINATFSGGTVVANFSSQGGPGALSGYWDNVSRVVHWGDGATWSRSGASEAFVVRQ